MNSAFFVIKAKYQTNQTVVGVALWLLSSDFFLFLPLLLSPLFPRITRGKRKMGNWYSWVCFIQNSIIMVVWAACSGWVDGWSLSLWDQHRHYLDHVISWHQCPQGGQRCEEEEGTASVRDDMASSAIRWEEVCSLCQSDWNYRLYFFK